MPRRDHDFEDRMLRIDGKKPTARDKWRAFSRLWRLANGHGAYQDIAAGEAIRVLFPNWRMVRLLDDDTGDGLVDRSHIPKFLRKRMIEHIRRKRLYGGHPEWRERAKVVARLVREKLGREVTPDQVAEVRLRVIGIIRRTASERGVDLPADDEAVLRLVLRRDDS